MEGPGKIRTGSGPLRCVGFAPPPAETSPSSVLRDSPSSARDGETIESPLGAALRQCTQTSSALRHAASERNLPVLPKLKLGKPKGMPRSKSQGNLRPAVEVPAAGTQTRSATSSPHAASSAGSEPVRIE